METVDSFKKIFEKAYPGYLEITKHTRILKPEEINAIAINKSVLQIRRKLIGMFPKTEAKAYDIPMDHKQCGASQDLFVTWLEMCCKRDNL